MSVETADRIALIVAISACLLVLGLALADALRARRADRLREKALASAQERTRWRYREERTA